MAMMTGDRSVMISVAGACSSTAHQTNYTIKVPYSSMAHTIQVITKEGGKITNVIAAAPSTMPSTMPSANSSADPTTTVEPIEDSKKGNKSKRK